MYGGTFNNPKNQCDKTVMVMILPTSVLNLLGLPPFDLSGYPVLKLREGPAHVRGNHPRLQHKKKYCLHHRLEEHPQHPWVFPSLPNIINNHTQLLLAFRRFPTTVCQSSYDVINIRPR